MQIDKYNSQKINIFSLLSIVMVVLIHSTYLEADSYPIARSVQRVCGSCGLSCVAIALFFFISGFFFFKGVQGVQECLPRIKKRIKTLLIPYILWNCVFVLWYVALSVIPGISGYVNGNIVSKIQEGTILNALKIIFWNPANFPLWFLRDLMIMVVLSPILYYMIKHLKWFVPILFAIPFINHHISPFFVLGGCIALHSSLEGVSLSIKKPLLIIATVIYIGISMAQIWMDTCPKSLRTISACCGAITLWKVYDLYSIAEKLKRLKPLLGYSFFIFVFHEPAFNIIKKIGLRLLGVHEWSLIILYIINPFIMCLLTIGVAKISQRFTPRIYSFLVGGR